MSSYAGEKWSDTSFLTQAKPLHRFLVDHFLVRIKNSSFRAAPVVVSSNALNKCSFAVSQASMSSLLLGSSSELRDPSVFTSLGFESLSSISLAFPSPPLSSLGIGYGLSSRDTSLLRNDQVICRMPLKNLVHSPQLRPSNVGIILIICSVFISAIVNILRYF